MVWQQASQALWCYLVERAHVLTAFERQAKLLLLPYEYAMAGDVDDLGV
jgi:hypothetical protein